MLDNHPLECQAMALFRRGDPAEATLIQDEFLAEVLASGEDHCTCASPCKFHGKCVECVIIHRGHCDHLPNCFRDMVNARIEAISQLTEHTMRPTPEG